MAAVPACCVWVSCSGLTRGWRWRGGRHRERSKQIKDTRRHRAVVWGQSRASGWSNLCGANGAACGSARVVVTLILGRTLQPRVHVSCMGGQLSADWCGWYKDQGGAAGCTAKPASSARPQLTTSPGADGSRWGMALLSAAYECELLHQDVLAWVLEHACSP